MGNRPLFGCRPHGQRRGHRRRSPASRRDLASTGTGWQLQDFWHGRRTSGSSASTRGLERALRKAKRAVVKSECNRVPTSRTYAMAPALVPDTLWEIIEPLLPLPKPKPQGGRPRIPDRACLIRIVFVLRSGIPWEMLPKELG